MFSLQVNRDWPQGDWREADLKKKEKKNCASFLKHKRGHLLFALLSKEAADRLDQQVTDQPAVWPISQLVTQRMFAMVG